MIITTFPDEANAKKISKLLLDEKLIACSNIIPGIKSLYWWEDKIQEDLEVIVFMKTRKELESKVLSKIREYHSYEIPAIYVVESMDKISDSYLKWIYNVTESQK